MPPPPTPPSALARARTFYAPSVVNKKRETLEALGELLGDDLGRFLGFLPRDALVNSSQEVIDIARRYDTSAWTLFCHYGNEAIKREQAYRPAFEALHTFGGDNWERLLSLFSSADFETNRDGIVALAKKYGEALPAVMRLFRNDLGGSDLWDFEAEHGTLTADAKRLYNLTHLPRYVVPRVDGTYDVSLLEEVVRNVDPLYQPGRPIALFIMTTNDPDSSFQNEYCTADLRRISESYRLIIIETGKRLNAARAVELANAEYSSSPHSPSIELLELAAHSCATSMGIGKPSPYRGRRDSKLTVNDELLFKRFGRYIVPGGHVVLNGCSTNDRNHDGDTLCDVVQRAIPHATVHAPESELLCHHYQFNKAGKVTGVCFELTSP